MEDPAKMELRHWANLDQTLKDFFRDQSTTKLTEVMAERDAAIAERDTAIAEKKSAYAERDAALLQRELAYADRNAAWMERDSAIAALTMLQANENNSESAAKLMQMVNYAMNRPPVGSNLLCLPSTVDGMDNMNGIDNNHTEAKPPQKQAKQQVKKAQKETTKKRKASGVASQSKKGSRSSKKKRKQQAQQEAPVKVEKFKQEDVSKSVIVYVAPYDLSSTPIPCCSCTGTNQQCYRWGSGGWQSACCTNFLSVYPLPVNQAKRGSRIAGRKMSGGAFKKLLERLSGVGVDITKPIDLKNHWAKHGTNRYVTIR